LNGIIKRSSVSVLGGLIDLLGQRVVEIVAGLLVRFVLIILATIVEQNVFWLLGILALFSWMAFWWASSAPSFCAHATTSSPSRRIHDGRWQEGVISGLVCGSTDGLVGQRQAV